MNKIKACIFDLDGTLIDSSGMWEEVDQTFFDRHQLVYDDFAREHVQTTFNEAINFLINHYNLAMTFEEVRQEFDELVVDEYKYNIGFKPGAEAFIKALRAKQVPICIATSCDIDNAHNVLKRLGVYDDFDFILTSEQLNTTKDEPLIYLTCAEKLGYDPSEIVVFEDMYHTLNTAKKAGFTTCAIRDQFSCKDFSTLKAVSDYEIDNFTDLMEEVK